MRHYSFLCLIALHDDAHADGAAQFAQIATGLGLAQVISASGLHFFGEPGTRRLVLPDKLGLVWGSVFDAEGVAYADIGPGKLSCWIGSNGAQLIDKNWGGYLALLRKRTTWIVVRDPSGPVPCYFKRMEGGVLLASDAELAAATGTLSRQIDWREVASQLAYLGRRSSHTALDGLSELMPGCALDVTPSLTETRTVWSPYRHTGREERITDFGSAVQLVRRVVGNTVGAWSGVFDAPLAELSGGLDSSIVTACLADSGAAPTCIAYRGGAADLDESAYAKAVTDRAGARLIVEPLDAGSVDLHLSAAAHLPRPTARSFAAAGDRQSLALGRRLGTDAYFSGAGGDNVFWYFNTPTAAIDRLLVSGPFGAFHTLTELAEMCEVSRATAIRLAFRGFIRRRRPPRWSEDRSFLRPGIELHTEHRHPWMPAPRDALPGTRAYVQALVQMQDQLEAFDRLLQAPIVAPLLSQPVVEQCLRTASWLWCHEGRNRAVARTAFAELLPREIVERQTKGGFEAFAYELLESKRYQIRDMLLGGMLAEHQIVDVRALADVLDGAGIEALTAHRLMRIVAVEAWLQSWRARGWS